MPLTQTTTRALAASIAVVAAGATIAGAAVFHLPVFGFGSTSAANAATAPVRSAPTTTNAVAPIKVVRTRYVDDIVHRPAPVNTRLTVQTAAPTYPPPPVAPGAFTATSPTIAVATSQSPTRATYHEGSEPDREGSDYAVPPGNQGPASPATAPEADQ
ncbi:MAG TPA: hypothetical protein VL856_20915 [Acidimicrobiia bacterium]|nr:hypothetical protein [Acidimicrobiia bacterium]